MSSLWIQYIDEVLKPFLTNYLLTKHKTYNTTNVAAVTKISRSAVGRMNKDYKIGDTDLHLIYELGVQTFEDWVTYLNSQKNIIENLVNRYWLSYRFTSERHLYVSSWLFNYSRGTFTVLKMAPKGINFEGKFLLHPSLLFTGSLHCGDRSLTYNTYLPPHVKSKNKPEEFRPFNISSFIMNVTIKHGDDIYNTVEFFMPLYNNRLDEHQANLVKAKSSSILAFSADSFGKPTNHEYLAYNFLTRYNVKTRIPILNRDNKIRINNYYEHKIRVACPVRSISSDKEFNRLIVVAKTLKKILIEKLKFGGNDIFFELTKYDSREHFNDPNPYLFEESKTIVYTHFIALIPNLKQPSMGVFAEIFYRLGKKLPVVIFYENEDSLGAVLNNLRNHHKLVNTFFYKKKMEEIPGMIEKNSECILNFQIP